jgi:glycosyltransferase involved in cell wall biosynthesis
MRLAARKRGLQLLRILRQARRDLPLSTRLRVVIAGDGPLRGSMERYLRRHDMTGWVSLPGALSRAQIKVLFAQGDIFVAPATLESFGIAALEARCGGLPVVARAEGGISEFIADDREGLLVGSDTAMADAIVALATDPATRMRIATHNRTTSPPVTWPDVLARTTELYCLAAERRALIDA